MTDAPLQCPSCRKPVPPAAAECAACGIIFAKWKTQAASGASGAPRLKASNGVSPMVAAAVMAALVAGCVWYARTSMAVPPGPAPAARNSLAFAWPPVVGQPYPDLQLLDQNGREVALSSFKGKVIVLEPVGMTCPACNAFSGANRVDIGRFEEQEAQGNLNSAEEFFPQYAGVSITDDRLVYVQLLLYNTHMKSPSIDDARRWATHFHLNARNHYVLVPKDDMTGPASYGMIPGFQIIDKDFILRHDGTGDNPKEDVWTQVLPDLARWL